MSIYNSPEGYAQKLNMTVEQATEMVDAILLIKKAMGKSRKCPVCFANTLEFDSGDMLEGIKGYVYCENDKIRTKDEEGEEFFDECDFTDTDLDKYLFTAEHDFDIIQMTASYLDIRDDKAVVERLGQTWSNYVDATNLELKQLLIKLGIKPELKQEM